MKLLLILIVSAFLIMSVEAADYKITGTVVNKQGKAIQGAQIKTYTENSFERFIFLEETNQNGKFEIETNGAKDSFEDIFILPAPAPKTFMPIRIPYPNWLSKNYLQLVKIRVKLGQKNIIDLGKIIVDFPFTTIRLAFKNKAGSPAFYLKDDEYSGLMFSLITVDGKQAALNELDSLADDGAIDENSVIQLALPRGRWKVRICQDYLCKRIVAESRYFVVGKSPRNIIVNGK